MTCLAEYPLAIRIVPVKRVKEPGAKIRNYVTEYRLYLTNGQSMMFKNRPQAAKVANDIGWWVGPKEPV